jgi:hypothetical protein
VSICDTKSIAAQRVIHGPMQNILRANRSRRRVTNGTCRRLTIAGSTRMILAVSVALSLLWIRPSLARPADGRTAFLRYCAACHGPDATGHGPVRAAFRNPPPDLTTLTKRNGTFPREALFSVLDQRTTVTAHGSRALPVWGETFWRLAGESRLDRSPQSRTMDEIVDFLETLQMPALAPRH